MSACLSSFITNRLQERMEIFVRDRKRTGHEQRGIFEEMVPFYCVQIGAACSFLTRMLKSVESGFRCHLVRMPSPPAWAGAWASAVCSRSPEEERRRREWAAAAASQATPGRSTLASGPASSLPPAFPGT